MEMFQSAASDKELLVADILLELPRMISILESQSAHRESTLPKNWACKRKRSSSSSSSSSSATISAANALVSMTSSPLLPLSPEPITAIMPAPPLPITAVIQPSQLGVSRKKPRIHVCSASDPRKPETKPLQLTVDKISGEGLKQNPTNKTRREELSENLSKLSQQRQAVAKGVMDAFRIYERLKACLSQLEEKEKELKLCLEREEQAREKSFTLPWPVACS